LPGSCPGNASAIMKQVIAVPDDRVLLRDPYIVTNHHRYFAPLLTCDHNRLPIQKFYQQTQFDHLQGYWLYGINDAIHSWDSRYLGPIPRSHMIGIYRPLWIWIHKNTVELPVELPCDLESQSDSPRNPTFHFNKTHGHTTIILCFHTQMKKNHRLDAFLFLASQKFSDHAHTTSVSVVRNRKAENGDREVACEVKKCCV